MTRTRPRLEEKEPEPQDRLGLAGVGPSLVGLAGLGRLPSTGATQAPRSLANGFAGMAAGAMAGIGAAGAVGAVGLPVAAIGAAVGSVMGNLFPARPLQVPPVAAAPVDPRAEVEQLATAFQPGPEQIVETQGYIGIGGVRLKRRTA